VRRWLNAAVADGTAERRVAASTGKPGRRPYEYTLTDKGRERSADDPRTWREMLTELQAKRAHALMKRGMSERRAIAAVTRGWRRPLTSTGQREV
jgi:DNA-binding PadR family transcriptional regulator